VGGWDRATAIGVGPGALIWEDSQFTAMIIRGPNARRDFHVDPSDEIFYMLRAT
jgi:hypothetical protein